MYSLVTPESRFLLTLLHLVSFLLHQLFLVLLLLLRSFTFSTPITDLLFLVLLLILFHQKYCFSTFLAWPFLLNYNFAVTFPLLHTTITLSFLLLLVLVAFICVFYSKLFFLHELLLVLSLSVAFFC